MECCSICLEEFEPHHTVVRPDPCQHTFHKICLYQWNLQEATCPLCRAPMTPLKIPQIPALMAMTLMMTHQEMQQRALLAFCFLEYIVQEYPTAQAFHTHSAQIISAMEQIHLQTIRLPFLSLSKRSDALKERRKWKALSEQLLDDRIPRGTLAQFRPVFQPYFTHPLS